MAVFAKVKFQFQGFHNWPGVSENHPHEHLRNRHRHMFHVTVWVEQFHNNRDIEYLEFRDLLVSEFGGSELCDRSCEMMAVEISEYVSGLYSEKRSVMVEVTEDGENGAYVTT